MKIPNDLPLVPGFLNGITLCARRAWGACVRRLPTTPASRKRSPSRPVGGTWVEVDMPDHEPCEPLFTKTASGRPHYPTMTLRQWKPHDPRDSNTPRRPFKR